MPGVGFWVSLDMLLTLFDSAFGFGLPLWFYGVAFVAYLPLLLVSIWLSIKETLSSE